MKFREYLQNEEFYTGVSIPRRRYTEIYKNPTKSEIDDIIKEVIKYNKSDDGKFIEIEDNVRYGFDKDFNLYAWNGNMLHKWVEDSLSKENGDVKFIIKFEVFKGNPNVSCDTHSDDLPVDYREKAIKRLSVIYPNDIKIKSFIDNLSDIALPRTKKSSTK